MIGVKIVVTGDTETIQKLSALKSSLMPEVNGQMDFIAEPMTTATKQYPSEVPNTPYVRTYNYLNSITTVRGGTASVVKYDIEQGMSYSKYLRDPDDQAPVHRGRWETTNRIVERLLGAVISNLVNVIDSLIQRITGG